MAREQSKDLVAKEPSVVSPLDEMERLFETMIGRSFMSPFLRRMPTLQEVSPSIDVFEENDEVVVRAEIPGMQKEKIDLNLTADTLTISGEKKQEKKVERKDYYRLESSFGSFTRTIHLPSEVQTDRAKAKYADGVLEVRMPKSPTAKEKVKKIPIQ